MLYGNLECSAQDGGLTVHRVAVQRQIGTSDCGAFAIAFTLHIALGQYLELVVFNQRSLRKHLVHCFTESRLTEFPFTTKKSVPRVSHAERVSFIHLYCDCSLPESYDDLVCCEKCKKCFHHKCVLFDPNCSGDWYCRSCQ